jgi:hypothetical protein
VSWGQLQKDVDRDRVRINGETYSSADVSKLVVVLSGCILNKLERRAVLMGADTSRLSALQFGVDAGSSSPWASRSPARAQVPVPSPAGDAPAWRQAFTESSSDVVSEKDSDKDRADRASLRSGSGVDDGGAPFRSDCGGPSCIESRVIEFARNVLLCSSRTVTGGDPFFAVELVRVAPCRGFVASSQIATQRDAVSCVAQVFRNMGLVLITPAATEVCPVVHTFVLATVLVCAWRMRVLSLSSAGRACLGAACTCGHCR